MGIQWQEMMLAGLMAMGISSGWAATNEPANDSFYRLMREASTALLKEGNSRFASGHPLYPNMDAEHRHNTVVEGQQPFATVLACSDSREPVELLFDRGVGDLFVIRVAGNVAGESELASIEYGVVHLHTPLLVVLGHTQCGAVTAVATGAELHGYLPRLGAMIVPAVAAARSQISSTNDLVPKAIEANVWEVIATVLRQSESVRDLVIKGRLQMMGAIYDLDSGAVKWLGMHPDQKALLGMPLAAAKPRGAAAEPTSHGPPAMPAATYNAAKSPKSAAATNTTSTPQPAGTVSSTTEPVEHLVASPGLDIDFGTSNVLPANKKKSAKP